MVYCISCSTKTRHLSILTQAYKMSPWPPLQWTHPTFGESFSTSSLPCMEILCIHYRLVFGVWYLKNKLWDHCLKRKLLWKNTRILWHNLFLFWNRRLLVSAKLGECLYCKNNNSCLAGLLRWSHCQPSHLATMISRPYYLWVLTVGCLKIKVYSNTPKKSGGP
jgi:hypothetical protein